MHRTAAHRADLGEAQHRPRQAPPQSIRRKSVPPVDLATRRRERPPRHPRTHARDHRRRRTPQHSRQPGGRSSRGSEAPLNWPFTPRGAAARRVTRRASASGYLAHGRRVTWRAVAGVTWGGFPGVTPAPSAGGPERPVRSFGAAAAGPRPRGHGAAQGGPCRVLRRPRGQDVEGPLDGGPGRPFGGAPRPKLPTHWQLDIRGGGTLGAGGEARTSDARHSDGGHAGVALPRRGAAPRGPGGDLLRLRDPGCQRRHAGGPWTNVFDGRRRQIPPGGSRSGPRSQNPSPAHGQQTGGPQGGPANVAFAIKCDVLATAVAGAST